MDKISIIISCRNQAASLGSTYDALRKELLRLPYGYEIIFVDNASRDASSKLLHELSEEDYACHYVLLSKRVSLLSALYLGIRLASGTYIITMDVHHPAYMVHKFVEEMKPHSILGGELVEGKKHYRQHLFKMMDASLLKQVQKQKDLSAFAQLFLQDESTHWIAYTDLERHMKGIRDHWYYAFYIYRKPFIRNLGFLVLVLVLCLPLLSMLLHWLSVAAALLLYGICMSVVLFFLYQLHLFERRSDESRFLFEDIKETTLRAVSLRK